MQLLDKPFIKRLYSRKFFYLTLSSSYFSNFLFCVGSLVFYVNLLWFNFVSSLNSRQSFISRSFPFQERFEFIQSQDQIRILNTFYTVIFYNELLKHFITILGFFFRGTGGEEGGGGDNSCVKINFLVVELARIKGRIASVSKAWNKNGSLIQVNDLLHLTFLILFCSKYKTNFNSYFLFFLFSPSQSIYIPLFKFIFLLV